MESLLVSELNLESPIDDSKSDTSRKDGESDTSTLVYGQEAFETFKDKVPILVRQVLSTSDDQGIEVERTRGGGYNRITAFRVIHKATDENAAREEKYILRVPRWDERPILGHVLLLEFLKKCFKIPVPDTIAYDITDKNVIESPYMIQRFIEGRSLLEGYLELGFKQRCQVAKQLGDVYAALSKIRSQHIGKLGHFGDVESYEPSSPNQYAIHAMEDTSTPQSWPYDDSLLFPKTSTLLSTIFEYRNSVAVAETPIDDFRSEYNTAFMKVVEEMDQAGLFKDVALSLCHLDFEPRNMLLIAENDSAHISAILDWDSATFAPMFVACKPPSWLWAWNSDDDEDELQANDEPESPENQEIKRIFEEAAGPESARFAYNPAYRLARSLVKLGFFDLSYNEDIKEVDAMLEEWTKLKVSYSVTEETVPEQSAPADS
ncbi:hypothetical protein LTS08_004594 [Lithohypha guttulata]|nr:hypothetical protein LTS08_004594 [Lithohypha guttulata]